MQNRQLMIILLTLFGAPLSAVEALRFAPLPMENRETTIANFSPLLAYLELQLQYPVTLSYYESNQEVIDAFANNQIDIAFFGPLPYLKTRQHHAKIEPLVFFKAADGTATYHCALIAALDERPTSLSVLKGQRFGLTMQMSTCGYLVTEAILKDQAGFSLAESNYHYLGSHEEVVRAVVAGQVDVGTVKDEFALKYSPLGIRVIAQSAAVPPVGLAGNSATLDAATLETIREVLLTTPPSVYSQWGSTIRHGMTAASDDDYAALRNFGDIDAIPNHRHSSPYQNAVSPSHSPVD
ncbi:MAG: phosphate/phosphite/phosphonate ABC transporter substrate-binding protein [Gammaproteobacteria bacterium]|nr:phosphate/phosphite/phosphonate ABC transporter substrate-binding protein [Gammaproteobacteria bacterium]